MNKEIFFLAVTTCAIMFGLTVVEVGGIESGEQAPRFTLTDAISGATISLSDYEGKVVLLDFFATWCGPCKVAIEEELVPLWEQYYADNPDVVFLSIDIWEPGITAQELQTFATDYNVQWPILMGTNGIADDYGIEGVPTLCIVDGDGVIRHVHLGCPSLETLKNEINALLGLVEPEPVAPEPVEEPEAVEPEPVEPVAPAPAPVVIILENATASLLLEFKSTGHCRIKVDYSGPGPWALQPPRPVYLALQVELIADPDEIKIMHTAGDPLDLDEVQISINGANVEGFGTLEAGESASFEVTGIDLVAGESYSVKIVHLPTAYVFFYDSVLCEGRETFLAGPVWESASPPASPTQPVSWNVDVEITSPNVENIKIVTRGWSILPLTEEQRQMISMGVGAYKAGPQAFNQMVSEEIRSSLQYKAPDIQLTDLDITQLDWNDEEFKLTFGATATIQSPWFGERVREELPMKITTSGSGSVPVGLTATENFEEMELDAVVKIVAKTVMAELRANVLEDVLTIGFDSEFELRTDEWGVVTRTENTVVIDFGALKEARFEPYPEPVIPVVADVGGMVFDRDEGFEDNFVNGRVVIHVTITIDDIDDILDPTNPMQVLVSSPLRGWGVDVNMRDDGTQTEADYGNVITASRIQEEIKVTVNAPTTAGGEVPMGAAITITLENIFPTTAVLWDKGDRIDIQIHAKEDTLSLTDWDGAYLFGWEVDTGATFSADSASGNGLFPTPAQPIDLKTGMGLISLAQAVHPTKPTEPLELPENVDVSFTLKVPPGAEVENLPSKYTQADTTYVWTGQSAIDAMRLIFTGESRTRISYWVGPATVTVEDISAKVGETIEIYENYVETVRIEDERTIVVSYEEGQSVENVRIRFSPGVRDVNIQTRRLPEKPPEVPLPPAEKGLVCYYLEIETPAPEQVESTTIVFKVPRVWIRTNSIDERTVRLLRYRDGEWAELDTTKLREDDNNVYFSAQVPGLSLFAVTGTTLPTQPVTTLPTQPVPPPGPPLYLWLGAGIVFVIFVLAVVWWRLATTRKKYGRRW